MLSDLEEVKKSISIVNKSFLTLVKPLRLEQNIRSYTLGIQSY